MSSCADGSSLGLAISNALMLTVIFSFGVSQLTLLDNQMIAVERVLEYIDTPSEGELLTSGKAQCATNKSAASISILFSILSSESKTLTWGDKGKIHFKSATVSFDGYPVLYHIKLRINPGERIGIVGRSGAGKSMLINSLYRLVNLSSGQIKIDDVDISTVGLHNLRRRLTILPQNPQLFAGTIRYNLDPLEVNSDEDIFTALKDVKLMERVDSNLYAEVRMNLRFCSFSVADFTLSCVGSSGWHELQYRGTAATLLSACNFKSNKNIDTG